MTALIMMDGITVQHAGELLFDTAATARQRARCAGTYLRSLEDVAFGLIFTSGIVVPDSLPTVGGETPGGDLIAAFSERAGMMKKRRTAPPDRLAESQSGQRAVGQWLAGLRMLRSVDYPYWREFILREAEAYLWPADSDECRRLVDPTTPPEDLKFGKAYWRVPILRESIRVIAQRLGWETTRHHNVSPQAAVEFAERVIISHAVIFEWYQRKRTHGAGPGLPITHLPHVTRTTFVPEDTGDISLWRLRRLLMPRVLGEILKGCDRRADLPRRIGDFIADGRLEPLRRRLSEALTALEWKEIDALCRDIERKLNGDEEREPLDLGMKIGVVGWAPKAEVEWRRRKRRRTSASAAALSVILRRSVDVRGELLAVASRIFPELRLEAR